MKRFTKLLTLSAAGVSLCSAKTNIEMPLSSELSPDGSQIAFSWKGDIWRVSSNGGRATRVTTHPAMEYRPHFSPDSRSIYFNSNRNGSYQIFRKNLQAGAAEQITKHTEMTFLEDLSRDGKTMLVNSLRDHAGYDPMRLFTIDVDNPNKENLLFDTEATDGKLSPDGTKVLFIREGVETYRKQYKGTQAAQVWLYDRKLKTFSQPVKSDFGVRRPLWAADGKSFYYLAQEEGAFNLYRHSFVTGENTQLTFFKDDGVILPTISEDGSTIVFRRLFDLYVLETKEGSKPVKINIYHNEVEHEKPTKDLTVTKTNDADFTPSGLEIAFTANDDIYFMDTVLREPVAATKTSAIEKNLIFVNKGKDLYYLKDDGVSTSICKLSRKDPSQYWWKAKEFTHTTIFKSDSTIKSFQLSPDKKKLSISLVNGKLLITDAKGKKARTLVSSWQTIHPQWSPDSKWIVYAQQDNDFNADIFIAKVDGSQPPINLTQHPDNEYAPVWSPDGKKIAFIGRRFGTAYDLFIADLYPAEKSSRDKRVESAQKAMSRDPNYKKSKKSTSKKPTTPKAKDTKKDTSFQLEGITQRFKRIPMQKSVQSITWSSDSRNLLVQFRGDRHITAVPASGSKPGTFANASGPLIRMDKYGKTYMVNNGSPAVMSSSGSVKSYPFRVYTQRDRRVHFQLAFRLAWRTMRDGFYDTAMNNKDWNAVFRKYDQAAYNAIDSSALQRIVTKMLGELNASHTGFRATPWNAPYKPKAPRLRVVHLGVHFDSAYQGDGLKIKHVLKNSNGTLPYSKLEVGDIITSINDKPIKKGDSLIDILMLDPSKQVHLHLKGKDGKERTINIAPTTFKAARAFANAEAIDKAEALVSKLSNNKLGYIHVERMMWNEFQKFERQLHEKGYGKDGIIIDVRNNGGGFTTDHLLTVLNQKRHAFTIPRNGGPGYPQDRIVYATWNKPIIVLCNQNSFSNAEIFTHAIKTLKRGKVVGVQTAGGVISTGSQNIPNAGNLRYPFRGWFGLQDGADMEMNGAMPDIILWPTPTEETKGIDKQLEKAIEVLTEDVKNTKPLHGKAIYKSTLKN